MLTEPVVSHLAFDWVRRYTDLCALVWWDAGGRDEVEAVWLLVLEGLEAMTCNKVSNKTQIAF